MAAVPGILRKWNPGIIPGLYVWVDGQDTSTQTLDSSNRISRIQDKSGNSIRFGQSSSNSRPTVSNVNKFRSVQFGSNIFLSNSTNCTINPNIAFSQFNLYSLNTFNSNQSIVSLESSNSIDSYMTHSYYYAPGINESVFITKGEGNDRISRINGVVNSNILFTKTFYNNNATFYNNSNVTYHIVDSNLNTNSIIKTQTTLFDLKKMFIGTTFVNDNIVQGQSGQPIPYSFLYGNVCEILLYKDPSSNNTILSNYLYNTQLEGYYAWKWGSQHLLSNTHPYKYRPPS